jgi:hypothetical protein
MRLPTADAHTLWVGPLIFFMMAFVTLVHTSTNNMQQSSEFNATHPLFDTADVASFILHSLAYYIACFAITCLLLICAAMILGLAMLVMELLIGAYYIVRSHQAQRFQRAYTAQHQSQPAGHELQGSDAYCHGDSWNYR